MSINGTSFLFFKQNIHIFVSLKNDVMKIKITGKSTTVEVEVPDWKVDIEIEKSVGDDIVQVYKFGGLRLFDPVIRQAVDYCQVSYKNLREKSDGKTSD